MLRLNTEQIAARIQQQEDEEEKNAPLSAEASDMAEVSDRRRHRQVALDDDEGAASESVGVEYEPASSEERSHWDYDYDYQKQEFLNPIIIKLPDGSLNIATESKDPNIREVLCWNCKSRLLYQAKYDTVSCHSCNEVVITKQNNSSKSVFVQCLNCSVDLL